MAEYDVHADLTVEDKATRAFRTAGESAGRFHKLMEGITGTLMRYGSIAGAVGGAFELKEAVSGAREYLTNVKRISDITGVASDTAGGMLSLFKQSGIEAGEAARAIGSMSKAGLRQEIAMEQTTGHMSIMRMRAQALGIDFHRGPEAALVRMSVLAKQGRLDVQDLGVMYRVPTEAARKLLNSLKGGPKAVREQIEEVKKLGIASQANVNMNERITALSRHISERWEQIKITIGENILPILEPLIQDVSKGLDSWLPKVQKWGTLAGRFLHDHLNLIKQMTKFLIFNALLQKTTGLGVGGLGGRALSLLRGGSTVAKVAESAVGGGGIMGKFATAAFGGGMVSPMGIIKSLFGVFGSGALSVLKIVGRFGLIATAILIVVEGVRGIMNNVMGVGDWLKELWENLEARFQTIVDVFSPITKMFSGEGEIGKFFQLILPMAIGGLTEVVDGLAAGIATLALFIKKTFEHPFDFSKNWADAWREQGEMTAKHVQDNERKKLDDLVASRVADFKAKQMVPPERGGTNMIFNNSRFDITQKFAEGFDPDRVAIAFSNDLAAVGDRGLSSLYAPIGSAP